MAMQRVQTYPVQAGNSDAAAAAALLIAAALVLIAPWEAAGWAERRFDAFVHLRVCFLVFILTKKHFPYVRFVPGMFWPGTSGGLDLRVHAHFAELK